MQSATNSWLGALAKVISVGTAAAPRGKNIKEWLSLQTITDMNYPILNVKERKLGYKFMAAEAAWILSGDNRVESISPYSNAISNFSDDGVTFFGAYGPKIRGQIEYVIDLLSKDTASRQAVINIWRENPPETKDVPCTISLQFIIRDGYLYLIDTMRSSDLWLGWPYDVFNMSMIARYVRNALKRETGVEYRLGHLYLNAGSGHIYEENLKTCTEIIGHWTLQPNPDLTKFNDAEGDELIYLLWEAADAGLFKTED